MADAIEIIRLMIEDYLRSSKFTSASPGATNVVKELAYTYEPELSGLVPAEEGKALEPSDSSKIGPDALDVGVASSVLQKVQNPSSILSSAEIARFIPIIGTILALPATAELLKRILTAPGMPFDPRFKRDIREEIMPTASRPLKAKIRQGIILVKITSTPTQRGEQIGQTGEVAITGIARYDQNYEAFQKGVLQ